MKIISLFIISLFLYACSSAYTPSEKVILYMKDMTPEQAEVILQKRIWGHNKPQGICGSRGFWYDNNSDMSVQKDKISMLAYRRGRELKKQSKNFDDIVVFEKQYYEYEFLFNKVNKIFIYNDPLLLPVFPACNKKNINSYYIIDLFSDKLSNLKFVVLADDFDKTMAALMVLLPDKPIIIK